MSKPDKLNEIDAPLDDFDPEEDEMSLDDFDPECVKDMEGLLAKRKKKQTSEETDKEA